MHEHFFPNVVIIDLLFLIPVKRDLIEVAHIFRDLLYELPTKDSFDFQFQRFRCGDPGEYNSRGINPDLV